MKKLIAILLMVTLCVCAFTSCSKPKGKTLDEVKAAGKLTIATSPDFPPFEFLEGDDIVGIEIDIMNLICDELGVELVVNSIDFDSVLTGVQATKFDCGVSGITVTAKREKNMRFTTPYYIAAQCIVVKDDSTISSKADLEGKKVSVQTGTTAEEFCIAELGMDNVTALKANADAKQSLKNGKVDAWVVDNLTAIQMVEENDGLKILDEKMTEEPYAFAFAYGSETLVAEINKILEKLIDDGTVAGIFEKYGEDYIAPENK